MFIALPGDARFCGCTINHFYPERLGNRPLMISSDSATMLGHFPDAFDGIDQAGVLPERKRDIVDIAGSAARWNLTYREWRIIFLGMCPSTLTVTSMFF
jgi:hypothetical protein